MTTPNAHHWGKRHIAGIGLGLIGVVGAFLPWATLGVFSKKGTDGDGIITLLLSAGFAGLIVMNAMRLLRLSWTAIACVTLGLAIAAIGIYDWADIAARRTTIGNTSIEVDPGTGLVLTVFVGFAMATLGVLLFLFWIRSIRSGRNVPIQESPDTSLLAVETLPAGPAPAALAPKAAPTYPAPVEVQAPIHRRSWLRSRRGPLAAIGVGLVGVIGAISVVVILLTSGGEDDESAVADLLQRESRTINARDWTTLYQMTDSEFRGRCSQDAMAAAIESAHPTLTSQPLSVSDIRIVLRDDLAEASYTVEVNGKAASATVPSEPDRFRKSNGEWFDVDEAPEDCNI